MQSCVYNFQLPRIISKLFEAAEPYDPPFAFPTFLRSKCNYRE